MYIKVARCSWWGAIGVDSNSHTCWGEDYIMMVDVRHGSDQVRVFHQAGSLRGGRFYSGADHRTVFAAGIMIQTSPGPWGTGLASNLALPEGQALDGVVGIVPFTVELLLLDKRTGKMAVWLHVDGTQLLFTNHSWDTPDHLLGIPIPGRNLVAEHKVRFHAEPLVNQTSFQLRDVHVVMDGHAAGSDLRRLFDSLTWVGGRLATIVIWDWCAGR